MINYIVGGLALYSLYRVANWELDSRTLHSGLLSDIVEQSMKNYDTDIIEPIDRVSIIMPSFNEDKYIESAASSVREQSIIQEYPEYFEFILVDSQSTDKTVELAEPYVDKIIISPRGKLTARNLATDQSNGNIIVSVDADTFYPYHWLNTLLKPFSDLSSNLNHEHIVGINGTTFDYEFSRMEGDYFTTKYNIHYRNLYPNQMIGRNSAYYKHAFYLAQRFPENVNQFDLGVMVREEEMNFGNRLSKLGKIIFKINASCVHLGGKKGGCRYGLVDQKECKEYLFGKERF